jgi:hypothetical protein
MVSLKYKLKAIHLVMLTCHCLEWPHTGSEDPTPHPARNPCAPSAIQDYDLQNEGNLLETQTG